MPHTRRPTSSTGDWTHEYTREQAAFPAGSSADKYWPPVSRIDGAFGDRNLMCSCPPLSAYAEPEAD